MSHLFSAALSPAQLRTHEEIEALRIACGQDVLIMGHHYQSDAIMGYVDKAGDSLELARMIAAIEARHIVFCGVHFMAETSCVLARPGQSVHLPDPGAACVMANMTPSVLLENVLKRIVSSGRKIVPLAYVNTSLAAKALVGSYGGAVCTSANAQAMLRWALEQGDGVLFLPDKNLGHNSADALGLPRAQRHVLDIRGKGGRLDAKALRDKTLLLWPGCCAVHARMRPEGVERARALYPGARVLVHPECSPETVAASDGAGSTSYLIKEAGDAPQGARLVIGTEINLVRRLAQWHRGRVAIEPLALSSCSNMAKTDEVKLLDCLRAVVAGRASPVRVDEAMAAPAREAIMRMLNNSAKPGA